MVVLHHIASPFWGGGEQYISDLCNALVKQHHMRFVFVCQPDTPDDLIARWQNLGTVYPLYPHTKNGKFDYCEAWHLSRIIRREHVDVLHVHNLKEYFVSVYAKILCSKPLHLIATQHLVAPAKHKRSWLWAYRHFDAFIFVSQKVADTFLCNAAVRRSCRRTAVIHNSIFVPEMPNIEPTLRHELGITDDLPLVLYHGRICAEKGIIQLLQAIAGSFSRKYILILAGEVAEADHEAFEAILAHPALQGYIFHLGFRTDIASLITQCDLGVVPSIVPEAASLSLLEHMSLGTAVISSNSGAQPEFARDGKEAVILPAGDWEKWITAIERLCADKPYRQTLGAAARKRIEQDFNYNRLVQQIYDLYAY